MYIKHGAWKGGKPTRLWKEWENMRYRCKSTSRSKTLRRYRGLPVAEEWQDFIKFREWALANGYQDDLTLDRIDSTKGYFPDNCRWATMKTQANNRSSNLLVSLNGTTMTAAQLADMLGVKKGTVLMRIRRGWSIERIASTKVGSYKYKYPKTISRIRSKIARIKWGRANYKNRKTHRNKR